MLDRKDIVTRPGFYKAELAKKVADTQQIDAAIDEIVALHEQNRILEGQIQSHRESVNAISKSVHQGKDRISVEKAREEVAALGDINVIEEMSRDIRAKLESVLLTLPNLPLAETPIGGKEVNIPIRFHGDKPEFDFETMDHVELAESLGLIDYERGRKLSGKGFPVFTEKGAYLQRAIIQYCIDMHHDNGYRFLGVPHILNDQCGTGAGQFPKFTDDVLHIVEGNGERTGKFLIPTAETAIANFHAGEIIPAAKLPIKLFAESSCFRNETGSHADERGIARTTEFKKVEMFQIVHPDGSRQTLDEMISVVERLVNGLGLHSRVTQLGTMDCSASMQATYDIEVWIPSMEIFKEVSSASLAGDYQARRTNTRFKDVDGKTKFPHFLNASGLAVPRVLMAILEQKQQKDGSVILPPSLKQYMYGEEVLKPIK